MIPAPLPLAGGSGVSVWLILGLGALLSAVFGAAMSWIDLRQEARRAARRREAAERVEAPLPAAA